MIKQLLDLTNYATDTRVARRTGSKSTQEFFTPYSIVKRMCDKIHDEDWADKEKTWLEPCMGDGNFICYIIWNRIQHGIDWHTALKTLYGLELMHDNVLECHDRVIDLLTKLCIDFDEQTARKIMEKNLVCADFFNWDFEHWKYIDDKKQ